MSFLGVFKLVFFTQIFLELLNKFLKLQQSNYIARHSVLILITPLIDWEMPTIKYHYLKYQSLLESFEENQTYVLPVFFVERLSFLS